MGEPVRAEELWGKVVLPDDPADAALFKKDEALTHLIELCGVTGDIQKRDAFMGVVLDEPLESCKFIGIQQARKIVGDNQLGAVEYSPDQLNYGCFKETQF